MTLDGLKEKLGGVYDFDKPEDCQKVINMLLRDLSGANKRAEQAATQLKLLAMLVTKNRPNAIEKAEKILSTSPNRSGEDMFEALTRMSEAMGDAGNLSDDKLVDEIFQQVWGELEITERPSALLEEMIRRFKTLAGIEEEAGVGDKVS